MLYFFLSCHLRRVAVAANPREISSVSFPSQIFFGLGSESNHCRHHQEGTKSSHSLGMIRRYFFLSTSLSFKGTSVFLWCWQLHTYRFSCNFFVCGTDHSARAWMPAPNSEPLNFFCPNGWRSDLSRICCGKSFLRTNLFPFSLYFFKDRLHLSEQLVTMNVSAVCNFFRTCKASSHRY